MGLINNSAYSYYNQKQNELGDGANVNFTIDLNPLPTSDSDFTVYVDGSIIPNSDYSYSSPTLTFDTAPASGAQVVIELKDKKFGDYRYISLNELVNNFMVYYVGPNKILNRANRRDVIFHAKRGIQAFSYDISKVVKIQEVEVGPSLSIPMPQDYVEYVKISFIDNNGIEHDIAPSRITSKPSEAPLQAEDYDYLFDDEDDLITGSSITHGRFKESYSLEGIPENIDGSSGINSGRFGGSPEHMNSNGVFVIDEANGTINFSSNLVGLIINIAYISDGLGTDEEMKVSKLAETALYKFIAYELVCTIEGFQEYIKERFKRERRAEMRNAKLRLSKIKPSTLIRVLRGQSKHIK